MKQFIEENGHLPQTEVWTADTSLGLPTMFEAGNWLILETSPYREEPEPPIPPDKFNPNMTANNRPIPWVAAASSSWSTTPYVAFNGNPGNFWNSNWNTASQQGPPFWLQLTCDASYVLQKYAIGLQSHGPVDFTMIGYPVTAGVDGVTLDTQVDQTWIHGTYLYRQYIIPKPSSLGAFTIFRLNATRTQGGGNYGANVRMRMSTMEFYGYKK